MSQVNGQRWRCVLGASVMIALPGCGQAATHTGGGAAVTTPSAPTSTGTVPWVATAAGPEPTPTPTPAPTPTGLPTCRSSNLSARIGRSGGWAQNHATFIVFTSHARGPCSLTGFPASVSFFDASGRVVTEYHASFTDLYNIGTLAPGGVALAQGVPDGAIGAEAVPGQATLQLTTVGFMCGHAVVTSLAVRLADGGVFRLPIGFGPDNNGDCLPETVNLSSFQSVVIATPSVPPPPDLTVTYHLPAHLHPGAVLRYSLTLTNVSGHRVVFSPCPGYTEFLKAILYSERHLLNCAAVPSLGPGEARTFDMQMSVPARPNYPTPEELVSWYLDPPFLAQNDPGPASVAVG